MAESHNVPTLLGEALLGAIRQAVREEIQAAQGQNGRPEPDRLLDAEEAAPLLKVTPRWLYRHAKHLPFTRRLSRKVLRFSEAGLLKWRTAKKSLS